MKIPHAPEQLSLRTAPAVPELQSLGAAAIEEKKKGGRKEEGFLTDFLQKEISS